MPLTITLPSNSRAAMFELLEFQIKRNNSKNVSNKITILQAPTSLPEKYIVNLASTWAHEVEISYRNSSRTSIYRGGVRQQA